MNKKTEESRIAYNKIASEYDTSREGQYTRFHIKELSNTIDLSEGDIVLDVACGNGTLLKELSKKAKIQANGLDVSENMIHVAKMRYPNMNFKVQPCYPLEWNDESIDIITICCAFHHFENPQGFVNECKRVFDLHQIQEQLRNRPNNGLMCTAAFLVPLAFYQLEIMH